MFSLSGFVFIFLVFYQKCLSYYVYDQNKVEYHSFRKIVIYYTEIIEVCYSKRASLVAAKYIVCDCVELKTEVKTIRISVDLYLNEVRDLIKEKNKIFKEDETILDKT